EATGLNRGEAGVETIAHRGPELGPGVLPYVLILGDLVQGAAEFAFQQLVLGVAEVAEHLRDVVAEQREYALDAVIQADEQAQDGVHRPGRRAQDLEPRG